MSVNSTKLKNKLSQQFYSPQKKGGLSSGFQDGMKIFEDIDKAINKNVGDLIKKKKKSKDKDDEKDKDSEKKES